ncbi:hypothetical protein [Paraflavitalea speifideaquila]|uniref:hypothetical protein n=1 Tax=Paraflavitalea speifideaquila TaxID=3076558 RepID=UPI0028E8D845|nr:hypothetical protein [Paraflavitalea speifideiaquila]
MVIGDTLPRPVAYQHNFYMSELVKMTNPPELLTGDQRGDRFYVKERPLNDSFTMGYEVVGGKAVLQIQLMCCDEQVTESVVVQRY